MHVGESILYSRERSAREGNTHWRTIWGTDLFALRMSLIDVWCAQNVEYVKIIYCQVRGANERREEVIPSKGLAKSAMYCTCVRISH